MSPMRALMGLVLLSLGLLSACALRPYYRQVLPPEVLQSRGAGMAGVMMRVVELKTERPIPGVKVLAGTGRTRVRVTSDAQGLFRLPVTPELLTENPLLEIIPPKGVVDYGFQLVREEPAFEPTRESGTPSPQG